MVRPDTFGDPKVYRTLDCIADLMNKMDHTHRRYFGKFINEFNDKLNNMMTMPKNKFSIYVRKLVFDDCLDKLRNRESFCDMKNPDTVRFFNHLRNFMHAKFDMGHEHGIHSTEKKLRKLDQQRIDIESVSDLPAFQVFGSESSKDYDVLVFVKHMSSNKEDNKSRIKKLEGLLEKKFEELGWPSKKINANVGILSKGMLVQVYKGTPDEVNNSLFETYALHEQCHRLEISKKYDRSGSGNKYAQLKLKRCGRFIISFFSREIDLRPIIKPAMTGDFKMRMDAMGKIDFMRYMGFPGKKDLREDIYKVIAFQLAQTTLLMRGTEIYSKEEVLAHYPELERIIMRKSLISLDLITLNLMLKELLKIGASEILLMNNIMEEIV